MHSVLYHLELLARRHDLRGMSQGFRSRSMWDNASQTVTIAVVLVVIAVGLLVFARLSKIYEERQATNSAGGLFHELCRIHNLNRATRRLLKRLAAQWGLESPALLFVEPDLLVAEKLPPDWQTEAAQVEQLRHQLFDTK